MATSLELENYPYVDCAAVCGSIKEENKSNNNHNRLLRRRKKNDRNERGAGRGLSTLPYLNKATNSAN
jgi:hypothetical protein